MRYIVLFSLAFVFLVSACINQLTPTKEELLIGCRAEVPNINFGTPLLYKNVLWSHMPLKIYIDFAESNKVKLFNVWKTETLADFRKGMRNWEEKTNGLITFSETNDTEDYDIYVKWVGELPVTATEKTVGQGGPHFIIECNDYTVIDNATIEMIVDLTGCRGQYISMHELGHVIGFGHSQNASDVMYHHTVGCVTEITEDELSVIRKLYG